MNLSDLPPHQRQPLARLVTETLGDYLLGSLANEGDPDAMALLEAVDRLEKRAHTTWWCEEWENLLSVEHEKFHYGEED